MTKFLKLYENLILKHPIKTSSITCMTTAFCGDLICQSYTNKKYDLKRGMRYSMIGCLTGPIVLKWYRFINNFTQNGFKMMW